MLCSQEHGHAFTFNMLTEMHKSTWGLFSRTVCKAVHPYCRRREGRREAEMDYLVGQHAEERAWSDMPSSPLLSRKCKSMINSCSFSWLVCILITLAQPRLQRSTRIVMYVALKAIDKSRTFKAPPPYPGLSVQTSSPRKQTSRC